MRYQFQAPSWGGSEVTKSRFSISGRRSAGTSRPKSMMIGMATPTVWLSPMKLCTSTRLAGCAIVVKVDFASALDPSDFLAVTVAV